MENLKEVVLALGANIGDKENNFKRVLIDIESKIGKITKTSTILTTEPWGFDSCDIFYNQVVIVETELSPEKLLTLIWEIERSFGREKLSVDKEVDKYKERLTAEKIVYLSRYMDIDIIFYGNEVINTPLLNIPHLLVDKREFVVESLMEIMPNFIHPVTGNTISEIYKRLKGENR